MNTPSWLFPTPSGRPTSLTDRSGILSGSDGQLFALNARRLNRLTRLHDKDEAHICGLESVDMAVRSAMAGARRVKNLRYIVQLTLDPIEQINTGDKKYKDSGIHKLKLWLAGDLST